MSLHVHMNLGLSSDPHPEPLPEHRVNHDCTTKLGYPKCSGAGYQGPEHCTCDTLTEEQHDQCIDDAWEAWASRRGTPCDDCAFRFGSPESDELHSIAASEIPFRCHKGMPVRALDGMPSKDSYCPRVDADGDAVGFPICAGWKRAHAALARRAHG